MEDRNVYPTKRKIPDKEMEALNIFRKDLLGKWNYTLKPKVIRKSFKLFCYSSLPPTAKP